MLLLRTFPLSLSILWRFLLVLPLWTVFYTVITVVSVVGTFKLMAAIPIVGLLLLFVLPLLVMVITYIISMHPYLIGIRIGLRVLGFETETSSKRLFGAAIGFGMLEALVAYVFSAALLVIFFVLVQSEVNLATALDVTPATDPMATLSRQLAFGTLTVISVLSSLTVMALRAALLPALASFAAGRRPDGYLRSAMDGFGAQFITMMLLMLMITAVSAGIIPFLGEASDFIGLTSILTNELSDIVLFAFGEKQATFTLTHAIIIGVAILVSVWLFCLQCAGAALSYETRARIHTQDKQSAVIAKQEASKDIGDLLRSRMPKHRK